MLTGWSTNCSVLSWAKEAGTTRPSSSGTCPRTAGIVQSTDTRTAPRTRRAMAEGACPVTGRKRGRAGLGRSRGCTCLKSRTPVLNLVRLLPRLHTHTVLAPTAPSDTAPRGRSGTPLTLGQYTIRTPDFDTPPFSRENPHMPAMFIGNAHPMLSAVHKLGTFKAIAPP